MESGESTFDPGSGVSTTMRSSLLAGAIALPVESVPDAGAGAFVERVKTNQNTTAHKRMSGKMMARLRMLELYTSFGYSEQANSRLVLYSFGEAWPYRLTARTDPSQGLNRGSIPRRVTDSGNKKI